MRRTFVLSFLLSLSIGALLWPRSDQVWFACLSEGGFRYEPLEQTLTAATAVFVGSPVDRENPDDVVADQTSVSSVVKGPVNETQLVSYISACPWQWGEGIFVATSDPHIQDWNGTSVYDVHYYRLTDENLATVSRILGDETSEPSGGPIYWATVPWWFSVPFTFGLASLVGIVVTTFRRDKEPESMALEVAMAYSGSDA